MKKITRIIVLFTIAYFSANLLSAQILNESFNSNTFPPAGWTNVRVSGSASPGTWARVTSGTNPTALPNSGSGMAQYNSYSWSSGNAADLSTPVLDFSAGSYAVSFWMYRDAGQAAKNDRVEVFVNTTGASAGGTLLGTINRSTALAPVVAATGWHQYTFLIPSSFNTATNHIIFKAISNFGNRIFLDDVQVFLNNAPDDVSSITSTSDSICSGSTVTLTANGVVGQAYWYDDICGGNLIGTGNSITINPTQTTTYYARNFDNGIFSLGCAAALITVNPIYNIAVSASICPGTTYTLPDGSTTDVDDVYTFNLASISGCDSIVTITLSTSSVINFGISESICRGSSFVFNGTTYFDGGQYADTLTSLGGCDSIVTLNLTVIDPVVSNITETICEGKDFLFDGVSLTDAGNYFDTLTAASGCDSIVNLSLTVIPSVITSLSEAICAGDSLLFDGVYLKNAGNYFDTLTAATGCDSIVNLNLIVNPLPQVLIVQNNDTLEANNSSFVAYQWYLNGNLLQNEENNTLIPTESGIYSIEIEDTNGCKNISDEYEYVLVSSKLHANGKSWKVYPNPAKNILKLNYKNTHGTYKIIAADGRIVIENNLEENIIIDVSALSRGIYSLQLHSIESYENIVFLKE